MEGQQRIGVIAELPRVLREMGEDPARVIAGAGVNPDMLRNPENSLTFVEVGRLIQACVTATGCEHFGFLVDQRSTTTSLGLVGRLMQNAPTLRDAILDLCTNQRRYVRGAVAYFFVQNETAFLGYVPRSVPPHCCTSVEGYGLREDRGSDRGLTFLQRKNTSQFKGLTGHPFRQNPLKLR